MGTLLVTVVHGGRRRDLAVRGDVPIADLLSPLAEALANDPPATRSRADPSGADRPTHPRAPAPGADQSVAAQASAAARASATRAATRAGAVALAPVCRQALPVERSLEACGVGHEAVLVLIGGGSGGTSRRPAGARPTVAG
jgi:WXG100 protein secretion system (Wss), protein YukD